MCIKDFKFNNVIYFSDSNKIHQEENANIDLQITNENKSLEEIVKDIAINYNFIVINVNKKLDSYIDVQNAINKKIGKFLDTF